MLACGAGVLLFRNGGAPQAEYAAMTDELIALLTSSRDDDAYRLRARNCGLTVLLMALLFALLLFVMESHTFAYPCLVLRKCRRGGAAGVPVRSLVDSETDAHRPARDAVAMTLWASAAGALFVAAFYGLSIGLFLGLYGVLRVHLLA